MRLSEAIRLGAMLKPQGFGGMSSNPQSTETCAYGAASDALGRHVVPLIEWPWLESKGRCPDCHESFWPDGKEPLKYLSIISSHLNDSHIWTRERIADWVETIENQQSEATANAIIEHAMVKK